MDIVDERGIIWLQKKELIRVIGTDGTIHIELTEQCHVCEEMSLFNLKLWNGVPLCRDP